MENPAALTNFFFRKKNIFDINNGTTALQLGYDSLTVSVT